MSDLSKFLVESILLGEASSVKDLVVVYSGRFQPFHKGHFATYQTLVKKFGKNNVYIGTSDKTDNQKSPFNFKEKVKVMTTMFGIPSNKIAQVKNPYAPTEILSKFNKETTAFITVVGEKDSNRLGGKYFEKYKDSIELEGYVDRGYVFISPSQPNAISGTDVRIGLKKGSTEDKKDFFVKKAYGKFNQSIFDMVVDKLSKLPESINLDEGITLDVEIGDTILMGRFKNKKVVVKTIGKDEHGMPTINGKKVATFRMIKEGYQVIFEDENDDSKYTHIGHGVYKQTGKEDDESSPSFSKNDGGKYIKIDGASDTTSEPSKGTKVAGSDMFKHAPDVKQKEKPKTEIPNVALDNVTKILPKADSDTFSSESDIPKISNKQQRQISMQIDKLVQLTNQAKENGEAAPNYNLCKITVAGTNLYCAGNAGIPREEMPQFKGKPTEGSPAASMEKDINGEVDTEPMFRELLKRKGIKTIQTELPSDSLKATQSELVGAKVAGMAKALENDPNHPKITAPIYVSRDGYVVDGHHRWAAVTTNAIRDGKPANMKVIVIDADIKDVIPMSNKFAEEIGVAAKKADTGKNESVNEIFGIPHFDNLAKDMVVNSIKTYKAKNFKDFMNVVKNHSLSSLHPSMIKIYKAAWDEYSKSESVINEIPMADLQQIDKYADRQLNPIDIVLTDKHFFDRLNDTRNGKEISSAELTGFFKRLGRNKKKFVEFLTQYNQVVAKDNRTNINIPFMLQANKAIAKTIMRKGEFKTTTPEYKFESVIAEALDSHLGKKHGVELDVYEYPEYLEIHRIVVPKEKRSEGIGTKVMNDIITYAKKNKKDVFLTPSSDFGGSKGRLIQFYKSFGFKDNKGGTRDFRSKESMKLTVETIKHIDGKWVVYPKDGGDRLGTHDTKEKALKQLSAIEISKNENINSKNHKSDGTIDHNFLQHHKTGTYTPDMGYGAELDTIDFDDSKQIEPGHQTDAKDTEDRGYEMVKKSVEEAYTKGNIFGGKLKIGGVAVPLEVELIGADNKKKVFIVKVVHIDSKYHSKLPSNGILEIPARIFRTPGGGWYKIKTKSAFEGIGMGYPDQAWIDKHKEVLKRLRKKFNAEKLQYNEPYALGGGISEKVEGDTIICDKCGWDWKIEDSGTNSYLCHKCGHTTTSTLTEGLLTEGGAYGHMHHPFDTEINLTFGQLKNIVNLALEGKLELTREKTDGQALAISWVNGRLVAARNKGHLANKGEKALDINGVATKFAGRGELEKAYNFAMSDLSKAIKSLSEKQREKIFKNGACFMNLEVIYPTSVNVIPYGQALLVFHGTMEYNEAGIAIGENQEAAKVLAGMIKQVNQNVQSAYTIQGPPVVKLPQSKNLTSLKGKYSGQITKLQSKFKLSDTDGIADYHQAWWTDFVTKKSPSPIDNRTLMGLVKRWAFYDKSFRLDNKNITDAKVLSWATGIDKNDHAKIAKDNIRPFEDIFLGVGSEVLSFMSSVLTANPDSAVRAMKDRLDKTISDVKTGGDEKKIAKLKMELQRLNAIGGKDKIVPNEGIVFVYNGNTMKLTGTFAPLNQILGLFYE